MLKLEKKESASYGIIGLGRFGSALAAELAQAGADLLIIDCDESKIHRFAELTDNAFVLKSLDKPSLLETGIKNCDVVVVCIGDVLDTSILATLTLVSLGIPRVISKASSAEHGQILEKLGAEVVYPERDMAVRLARRLETSHKLDIIQLGEKVNFSKIAATKKMARRSVRDLGLRAGFGLNIIAIENKAGTTDIITPEHVIGEDDILYLAGSQDGLIRLGEWMEKSGRR